MRPRFSFFSTAISVILFCVASPVFSQTNQTSVVPPSSQAAIQEIASTLAQKAKKAGCESSRCLLLVTDFYTSPESTSRLGLKLSDEFAVALSKALPSGTIIDRSSFRQFMNRDRIPLAYLKPDDAKRWLGRQFAATTILSAEIAFNQSNGAAKFKLLDSRFDRASESVKADLPPLSIGPDDLHPGEPYAPLPKTVMTKEGEVSSFSSGTGVIPPHCTYMPNPPFTDEARRAKLSGYLMIDAIIGSDGKATAVRISRGLPYNLNEQAVHTLESWSCKPASLNGQPFPAMVTFEVNFKMY
jgi:TonB family protein